MRHSPRANEWASSQLVLSWGFAVFVVLAATPRGGAQTVAPKPVEGKITWVYTYAEGKKLGEKTGKPLFVVFRCER